MITSEAALKPQSQATHYDKPIIIAAMTYFLFLGKQQLHKRGDNPDLNWNVELGLLCSYILQSISIQRPNRDQVLRKSYLPQEENFLWH